MASNNVLIFKVYSDQAVAVCFENNKTKVNCHPHDVTFRSYLFSKLANMTKWSTSVSSRFGRLSFWCLKRQRQKIKELRLGTLQMVLFETQRLTSHFACWHHRHTNPIDILWLFNLLRKVSDSPPQGHFSYFLYLINQARVCE